MRELPRDEHCSPRQTRRQQMGDQKYNWCVRAYLLEADFHSPLTEAATADVDAILADEACEEDRAGAS